MLRPAALPAYKCPSVSSHKLLTVFAGRPSSAPLSSQLPWAYRCTPLFEASQMLPSRVPHIALIPSNPRRIDDQFRPSYSQILSDVAHQILPSGNSQKLSTPSGVVLSGETKARHFFS